MKNTSLSMRNKIKHIILNFFLCFGKKNNEILLESFPDFSCNTFELYRQMKERKFDKEYKIVWLLHDEKSIIHYKDICNDYLIMNPNGIWNKLKYYRRKYKARAIITSNAIIPKISGPKNQLHFYLDHGSQLKDVRINGKKIDIDCDYFFSQSTFFNKYHKKVYALTDRQIVTLGLPRYDQLYRNNTNLSNLFQDILKYKKIICWLPTFRKHMNGIRIDCSSELKYGLPLINNDNSLKKLTDYLEKSNILLIIKPHPAQDISNLLSLKKENIRIVFPNDFQEKKIQLDEFLTQVDALITDYSSIYYDFLILNKPIAITMDDFSAYEKQKGFVFENPEKYLVGEKIFNINDLLLFFEKVINNQDDLKDERGKINNLINDYFDCYSSERVMKFIYEKIKSQKWN